MSNAQFAPFGDHLSDFSYGAPSNDAAGMRLTVSVFADRGHLRDELGEDAASAGFRLGQVDRMSALLDGPVKALGDVVLIDCPVVDAATVAALARLDQRAAHMGAELIVSTSVDGLDGVFGAMDQCNPQILVAPSRAERIIALGHVLSRLPQRRVRELSEEDRLVLLRLTQQVTQIGERIDRLGGGAAVAPVPAVTVVPAFRFDAGVADAGDNGAQARTARAPLPDPRLVRRIIRQRQMRARFFDGDLFADPAWDMLLDLTAARAEHARVSVTSLCIASGVPPTTALRWIGQMTEAGLLKRIEDETDRRRAFITLTDKAVESMARYFVDMGDMAGKVN